jgi:hypothetical protein
MSAQVAVDDRSQRPSECWCCGVIDDPAKLVRLGNHPEVMLCIRCAHWISKRAWQIEDQSRVGLAVRGRDQLRRIRQAVMQRGWQHSRFLGRPLRWLGKHLP